MTYKKGRTQMNPYTIIGAITVSAIFYTGMVALFAWMGTPLISAMALVYGSMLLLMMTMQRRASVSCGQERRQIAYQSHGQNRSLSLNHSSISVPSMNFKSSVQPVSISATIAATQATADDDSLYDNSRRVSASSGNQWQSR